MHITKTTFASTETLGTWMHDDGDYRVFSSDEHGTIMVLKDLADTIATLPAPAKMKMQRLRWRDQAPWKVSMITTDHR